MPERAPHLARAFVAGLAVLAALSATLLLSSSCAKPLAADLQAEWRDAADWSLLVAGLDGTTLDRSAGNAPSLPAPWEIEGDVIGQDGVALHGVVARAYDAAHSPRYAVLLRDEAMRGSVGASGGSELRPAPWPDSGRISARFLLLYESLAFRPIDGTPTSPLAQALRDRIGASPVTLAGHGTGAVLATYLSLDLARDALPNAVAARLFGAPPAGDAAFAAAYSRTVVDHRAYDNVRDPVTHIAQPFDPDAFGTLDHATHLDPARVGVFVRDTPECNHLALAHAAMLDFRRMSIEDWQARLAAGRHPRDCIGPSPAARIVE